MPKGKAPRISDKSLKRTGKNDFNLDKTRGKIGNKKFENESSLKSDMDESKYTLRKEYKKNSEKKESYVITSGKASGDYSPK